MDFHKCICFLIKLTNKNEIISYELFEYFKKQKTLRYFKQYNLEFHKFIIENYKLKKTIPYNFIEYNFDTYSDYIEENEKCIEEYSKNSFLFITSQNYKSGEYLNIPYSHDYKGFVLINGFLKLGWNCYIYDFSENEIYRVLNLFPILNFKKVKLERVEILYCNYSSVLFMNELKFNKSIFDISAIHWVEEPKRIENILIKSLNFNKIITTNEIMKQYCLYYYERYLEKKEINNIPLGILEDEYDLFISVRNELRKKMELENKIVIINSGGVWGWTDMITFLKSFVKIKKNFVLIIPGIKQPSNTSPQNVEIYNQILEILRDNKENIIYNEWSSRKKVLEYLSISDIGLNVNKDCFESYLSSRVRCFDYINFSLPIITTEQDELSKKIKTWNVKKPKSKYYEQILLNITIEKNEEFKKYMKEKIRPKFVSEKISNLLLL